MDLLAEDVLLRDVAAIEELTDILVLDEAGLVDESSGETDVLEVVAGDDDLILDAGALDLAAVSHLDVADTLLAEEVVDGEDGVVLDGVARDREVSIDEAHLVLEALGDTGDHVSDVGQDGLDASTLLTVRHPGIDDNLVAV